MKMPQPLSGVAGWVGRRRGRAFQADDYWRRRHASYRASIRAVGNSTLTDEQNEQDYAARWNEVSAALGSLIPDPAGRTLLDAGCGIGLFSRRYERAGYSVVGVDLAQEAASVAAEACQGEFIAGNLAEIRLGRRFDVVTCHGVLVCIVDGEERAAALRNLVEHLEPGGLVMVQEPVRAAADTSPRPPHVDFRTLEEIATALTDLGLGIEVQRVFSLPNEPSPQCIIIARRPA